MLGHGVPVFVFLFIPINLNVFSFEFDSAYIELGPSSTSYILFPRTELNNPGFSFYLLLSHIQTHNRMGFFSNQCVSLPSLHTALHSFPLF